MLGPFIQTKTISAHFMCVLFSPVTPDESSQRNNPDDDAIAGVSARFIRNEGLRAERLVTFFGCQYRADSNYFLLLVFYSAKQICNYCKAKSAHTGCCMDTGTDSVIKFCSKKYHIDCGIKAGASFNVCKDRGTVSICYEHREPIERYKQNKSDYIVIRRHLTIIMYIFQGS